MSRVRGLSACGELSKRPNKDRAAAPSVKRGLKRRSFDLVGLVDSCSSGNGVDQGNPELSLAS